MMIQIDPLFAERPETPLFLVESGSRLWGIASPDSDYDVRGIHLISKEQYYDYVKFRDVIEIMDGQLDYVSFDIDKAFTLLSKSNPNVIEWIRSHIIYKNNLPEWDRFKAEILSYISYELLYHHYLSIAKGQYSLLETGTKATYKVCFYGIRSILSAQIAANGVLPNLIITELFEQFANETRVVEMGKRFIGVKREHKEHHFMSLEEKETALEIFAEAIEDAEKMTPVDNGNREKLASLLTEYAILVKDTFYK